MKEIIKQSLEGHSKAFKFLAENCRLIEDMAALFVTTLKNNGKIIFMGNGGSAADAQHLAAELVGRFKKDRKSLPALALSVNTSILTAIGNDYGFDKVFVRQIESLANSGDLVVGISTSGKSANIIAAIRRAKELNIKTAALLGKDGGELSGLADMSLILPLNDTPRIQEMHILIGHIICEIIEENLT